MKILIVKTSALGDIITVYPVISFLKQRFPDAEIDWVTEKGFSGLVSSHPHIHRTITIETKRWKKCRFRSSTWKSVREACRELRRERYDLLFDFQGNIKSGIVTRLARANKKVGYAKESVAEWPNLYTTNVKFNPPKGLNVREDHLSVVRQYFSDESETATQGVILRTDEEERARVEETIPDASYAVICPGSAWINKMATEECLHDFLKGVQAKYGLRLVFVWGNEEELGIATRLWEAFRESSCVAPRFSFAGLQNLMGKATLVVAMDSFPLHLAGTTDTPSYSVFGPSLGTRYRPIGPHHMSYQGGCPYGVTFEKRCSKMRTCKTGLCTRGIKGEELLAHFHPWWDSIQPPAKTLSPE